MSGGGAVAKLLKESCEVPFCVGLRRQNAPQLHDHVARLHRQQVQAVVTLPDRSVPSSVQRGNSTGYFIHNQGVTGMQHKSRVACLANVESEHTIRKFVQRPSSKLAACVLRFRRNLPIARSVTDNDDNLDAVDQPESMGVCQWPAACEVLILSSHDIVSLIVGVSLKSMMGYRTGC